jgi:hypothetical protein
MNDNDNLSSETYTEFLESLTSATQLHTVTGRYTLDDEMRAALVSVLTPILERKIADAGINQIDP